jgi:DNA-binding MarR family transcriptional regulator
MNAKNREDSVTLEILDAIHAREDLSQRYLADRLGVALGLANLYLKRCVRKGLVKVTQAPANRYLYYLTPKGFSEKSRLTALYLSVSLDLFRKAGKQYSEILEQCSRRQWQRIVFCGVSELAEIAFLRMHEYPLTCVGTFMPGASLDTYLRMPVWPRYADVPTHDACLLTALSEPALLHASLDGLMEKERIFIPDLLGFSPR